LQADPRAAAARRFECTAVIERAKPRDLLVDVPGHRDGQRRHELEQIRGAQPDQLFVVRGKSRGNCYGRRAHHNAARLGMSSARSIRDETYDGARRG
jgi:hypothetical protein